MIIDPVDVLKKTTSAHLIPTAVPTSVPGLPPVLPDPIEKQFVGEDGKRTLWVVFVLMVIASAAFAAMSWRVPVVRTAA